MPTNKPPHKRTSRRGLMKDAIVRWPNRTKKDKRGPWLYGLVVETRASAVTVQVLDFAWRNAWDLTTVHLSWSDSIHEIQGSRGLHELVVLTLDGRTHTDDGLPGMDEPSVDDKESRLPGTGEDSVFETPRPLDRFSDETLEELTRRYKGFVAFAATQLYRLAPSKARKDRALFKRRLDRLFRVILPMAVAADHLTWWEIVGLLCHLPLEAEPRHSLFETLAPHPETQQLVLDEVYWPMVSSPQAMRARYGELRESDLGPQPQVGDELAYGLMRLHQEFGHWSDVNWITRPETWKAAVWERLHARFQDLPAPVRARMFREHWQQPYFLRLLNACLKGLAATVGDAKASETVNAEIRQIIDEHARRMRPDWMGEAEKLLPGLRPPDP